MSETFTLKQGETKRRLRFALEPATRDLTGATVRFRAWCDGVNVIDAAAVLVAPLPPVVEYEFTLADSLVIRDLEAEFAVTYPDTKVEIFPNETFIPVRIKRSAKP